MISNKMKVILTASVICSAYLFAAGETWSYTGKISGTPHDLSAKAGLASSALDNAEVCVYCHTPHAANTAFTGAPLWNKKAPVTGSFTMYGATAANTVGTTIAGTSTDQQPASPSLACLSCHDGVSGIDSIVNAPGSGSGSLVDSATPITTGIVNANANIGQVLNNDHPVSIAYTAGKASLRATTTVLADTNVDGDGLWVGATTVANLLRNSKVECGSCHDPHNGYASTQLGVEVNYLRRTNKDSQLCLGCHDK